MVGMDLNHYRIVEQGLTGERAVDEQTLASLEILSERLERLKKLDKVFAGVEFSSAVRKLKARPPRLVSARPGINAVAVA